MTFTEATPVPPTRTVGSWAEAAANARLYAQVSPELASDPNTLLALSQGRMNPSDVYAQTSAASGVSTAQQAIDQVSGWNPSKQRSWWAGLSTDQQAQMTQLGFQPPASESSLPSWMQTAAKPLDVGLHAVEKVAGPVIGTGLQAVQSVGQTPLAMYQKIREGKDWEQVAALAGGTIVAGALLYLSGGAAAPEVGGFLDSIGAGLAASGGPGIAGTALTGLTGAWATKSMLDTLQGDPSSWWVFHWGQQEMERQFQPGTLDKASLALGDERTPLVNFAKQLAFTASDDNALVDNMLTDFAGRRFQTGDPAYVRSVLGTAVEEMARRAGLAGSPEYQSAYAAGMALVDDPRFLDAVQTMRMGKISPGRDLARLVGLNPDHGAGKFLSGGSDAVSWMLFDPLLAGGKALEVNRAAQAMVHFTDAGDLGAQIGMRLVNDAPTVRRFQQMADTLNSGSASQFYRLFPDSRDMYHNMLDWQAGLAADVKAGEALHWDPQTVGDYFSSQAGVTDLLSGKGASFRYGWVQLPRITYAGAKAESLRQGLMDGIRNLSDLQMNLSVPADQWLPELDASRSMDTALNGTDPALFRHPNALVEALAPSEDAGRISEGGKWVLRKILGAPPGLARALITRAPEQDALFLEQLSKVAESSSAYSEIGRFTETMSAMGVPSYARDAWRDAIMDAANTGAQRQAIISYIKTAFATSGLNDTPTGRMLMERFLQRSDETFGATHAGVDLAEASPMIAVPDMREMRKAAMETTLLQKALNVTDTDLVNQAVGRFWRPAVLLRVGFVARAGGDELLNWLSRVGFAGAFRSALGRWAGSDEELVKHADFLERAYNSLQTLKDLPAEAARTGSWWSGLRSLEYDPLEYTHSQLLRDYSTRLRHLAQGGIAGRVSGGVTQLPSWLSQDSRLGRVLARDGTWRSVMLTGVPDDLLAQARQFLTDPSVRDGIMSRVGGSAGYGGEFNRSRLAPYDRGEFDDVLRGVHGWEMVDPTEVGEFQRAVGLNQRHNLVDSTIQQHVAERVLSTHVHPTVTATLAPLAREQGMDVPTFVEHLRDQMAGLNQDERKVALAFLLHHDDPKTVGSKLMTEIGDEQLRVAVGKAWRGGTSPAARRDMLATLADPDWQNTWEAAKTATRHGLNSDAARINPALARTLDSFGPLLDPTADADHAFTRNWLGMAADTAWGQGRRPLVWGADQPAVERAMLDAVHDLPPHVEAQTRTLQALTSQSAVTGRTIARPLRDSETSLFSPVADTPRLARLMLASDQEITGLAGDPLAKDMLLTTRDRLLEDWKKDSSLVANWRRPADNVDMMVLPEAAHRSSEQAKEMTRLIYALDGQSVPNAFNPGAVQIIGPRSMEGGVTAPVWAQKRASANGSWWEIDGSKSPSYVWPDDNTGFVKITHPDGTVREVKGITQQTAREEWAHAWVDQHLKTMWAAPRTWDPEYDEAVRTISGLPVLRPDAPPGEAAVDVNGQRVTVSTDVRPGDPALSVSQGRMGPVVRIDPALVRSDADAGRILAGELRDMIPARLADTRLPQPEQVTAPGNVAPTVHPDPVTVRTLPFEQADALIHDGTFLGADQIGDIHRYGTGTGPAVVNPLAGRDPEQVLSSEERKWVVNRIQAHQQTLVDEMHSPAAMDWTAQDRQMVQEFLATLDDTLHQVAFSRGMTGAKLAELPLGLEEQEGFVLARGGAWQREQWDRILSGADTGRPARSTYSDRGWKLHLDPSTPESAATISEHLTSRGVEHKVGRSGDQAGKGMTVYVGHHDDATRLATDLEQRFGHLLNDPSGEVLHDDRPFTGKVWGRFTAGPRYGGDDVFHQYGREGVPYLAQDVNQSVWGSGLPADAVQRSEARIAADPDLAALYGSPPHAARMTPPTNVHVVPFEVAHHPELLDQIRWADANGVPVHLLDVNRHTSDLSEWMSRQAISHQLHTADPALVDRLDHHQWHVDDIPVQHTDSHPSVAAEFDYTRPQTGTLAYTTRGVNGEPVIIVNDQRMRDFWSRIEQDRAAGTPFASETTPEGVTADALYGPDSPLRTYQDFERYVIAHEQGHQAMGHQFGDNADLGTTVKERQANEWAYRRLGLPLGNNADYVAGVRPNQFSQRLADTMKAAGYDPAATAGVVGGHGPDAYLQAVTELAVRDAAGEDALAAARKVVGPYNGDTVGAGMSVGATEPMRRPNLESFGDVAAWNQLAGTGTARKMADSSGARFLRVEDQPEVAMRPRTEVVDHQGLWDKAVNYGFGNVVGPLLDKLIRTPQAFEAYMRSASDAHAASTWLRDPAIWGPPAGERRMLTLADGTPVWDGVSHPDGGTLWRMADSMPAGSHWSALAGDQESVLRGMRAAGLADPTDLPSQAWNTAVAHRQTAVAAIDRRLTEMDAIPAGWRERFATQVKADEDGLRLARDYLEQANAAAATTPERMDQLSRWWQSARQENPGLARQAIAGHPDDSAGAIGVVNRNLSAWGKTFSRADLQVLDAAADDLDRIGQTVHDIAITRTVNDVLPFIHRHDVRTQFSEEVRNIIPFWHAETQWMQRLGRATWQSPEAIRKAQLVYQGLKDVGFVRQDSYGNDIYVYPGGSVLADVVAKIPGMGSLAGPVQLTGQVKTSLPGLDSFGAPSVSPLIGVPLSYVAQVFPELQPYQQSIMGDRGTRVDWTKAWMPTTLSRLYDAVITDPKSSSWMAGSMMQAAAVLEANGHGLPDSADTQVRQQYQDRLAGHARVLATVKALFGFLAPTTPQPEMLGKAGSPGREGSPWSFQALTGLGSPAATLNPVFVRYLRNYGPQVGVQQFLHDYPDATPNDLVNENVAYTVGQTSVLGKAPLSATATAGDYLHAHRQFVLDNPLAGAWLMPPASSAEPASARSAQVTYEEQAMGLRAQKAPSQFVDDIKFAAASGTYFDTMDQFDTMLANLKSGPRKTQLTSLKTIWQQSYYAAHPIFADQLQSGDGRQRRDDVIQSLVRSAHDPLRPQTPHAADIYGMLDGYLTYESTLNQLAGKTTRRSAQMRKELLVQFTNWGNSQATIRPEVAPFWQGVLAPTAKAKATTTSA